MSRVKIDDKTLRRLFAKSGNCCAYPGCNMSIYLDDGTLVGECCHIEAYSPGGPRYNPNNNDVNSYENLILLCPTHHKVIDKSSIYSVEMLRDYKESHERRFSSENRSMTDDMLRKLSIETNSFTDEMIYYDVHDTTGLKYKLDDLDKSIDELIEEIQCSYHKLKTMLDDLKKSDETLFSRFNELLDSYKFKNKYSDSIPYDENPLCGLNWELHNLGVPNVCTDIEVHWLLLRIKVLEQLCQQDPCNKLLHDRIVRLRSKFREFYKDLLYSD